MTYNPYTESRGGVVRATQPSGVRVPRPDIEGFDEEDWIRQEMGRIYKQARLDWQRLGEIQPFETYLTQNYTDVAAWRARQQYNRLETDQPFFEWLAGQQPELAQTVSPEMFRYQPRYERGFQALEGKTGLTSREWDWVERNYGDLLTEFKTTLPTWAGGRTETQAKKIEETWTSWLKEKAPEVKEEFWKLSPYERGERPGYMAPRIRSVEF